MNKLSLLERLRPDIKQQLDRDEYLYPAVIKDLKFLLSQQIFYSDLTVGQVIQLCLFSTVKTYDRSAFNWKYGDDLFEEEKEDI